MDDKQYFEGTWAIVSSFNKTFIGKIDNASTLKELKLGIFMRERATWLELNPVFDYALPTQMNAQGVTKVPILTPLDMLNDECPVYVQVTSIIFFDDMKEEDKIRYKKFVVMTRDQMQRQRTKETGIELVDASALSQLPRRQ